MGQPFDDPSVKEEVAEMPFHVESDTFGRPVIAVDFCNGRQYFNVEAMIGMFISYMVGLAEKYTNCQIRDIVITCPAYFTENQRRAVKDAGTVAGYNVLCILNEPTEMLPADKKLTVKMAPGGGFAARIYR